MRGRIFSDLLAVLVIPLLILAMATVLAVVVSSVFRM
jgi:hypothetical protein